MRVALTFVGTVPALVFLHCHLRLARGPLPDLATIGIGGDRRLHLGPELGVGPFGDFGHGWERLTTGMVPAHEQQSAQSKQLMSAVQNATSMDFHHCPAIIG